jgi:hypothetical protein
MTVFQLRESEGFDGGLTSAAWYQRFREIAEPLVLTSMRPARAERHLRRTYQAATEIIGQASDAPMNAAGMLVSTVNEKTIAKASMPRAPSAVPAASTAAASSPRRAPVGQRPACGGFRASRSGSRWHRRSQGRQGRGRRRTPQNRC